MLNLYGPVLVLLLVALVYGTHVQRRRAALRSLYMESVSHASGRFEKLLMKHWKDAQHGVHYDEFARPGHDRDAHLGNSRSFNVISLAGRMDAADLTYVPCVATQDGQEPQRVGKHLRFVLNGHEGSRAECPAEDSGAQSGATRAASACCVQLALRPLLRRADLDVVPTAGYGDVGQFDEVFLLSEAFEVLAAQRRSGSPQALRLAQQGAESLASDGRKGAGQAETGAFARVVEREVAGRTYLVFLHPVDFRVYDVSGPPPSLRRHLILAGAVDKQRFLAESLALSPTTWMWVFLALGLLIVVYPVSKIWSLGPCASYGPVDVGSLVATLGFAALLACAGICAVYAHHLLDRRLSADLASTMRGADRLINGEFSRAAGVLATVQDGIRGSRDCFYTELSGCRPCEDEVAQADDWCECDRFKSRGLPSQPWPDSHHYGRGSEAPTIVGDYSIVQVDDQGQQLARFSSRPRIGADKVNVAGREYFQRARQLAKHGVVPGPVRVDSRPWQYSYDIVQSANTRDHLLVVAGPSTHTEKACGGPPLRSYGHAEVTYVSTNMPLLSAGLVLPKDHVLALATGEGELLLHKYGTTPLTSGYNLLRDVEDGSELAAAMYAKVPHEVDVRYRGKPMRVRVQYLPLLDRYLIVMAPTGFVSGTVATCVWVSVVGSALYLALVLVGLASLQIGTRQLLRDRRLPQPLLRPQWHLRPAYLTIAMLLGVLSVGLLLWAVCGRQSREWLLAAHGGILILGGGVLPHLARRARSGKPRNGPKRTHAPKRFRRRYLSQLGVAYLWCISSAIAFTIAVPAVVLFAVSYDLIMQNTTAAGLVHYVEEDRWLDDLMGDVTGVSHGAAAGEPVHLAWLAGMAAAGASPSATPLDDGGRLRGRIADAAQYLGLLGDTTTLLCKTAPECPTAFSVTSTGQLHMEHSTDSEHYSLDTELPRFSPATSDVDCGFAGMLAGVVGVALLLGRSLLRQVGRRLLFFSILDPKDEPLQTWYARDVTHGEPIQETSVLDPKDEPQRTWYSQLIDAEQDEPRQETYEARLAACEVADPRALAFLRQLAIERVLSVRDNAVSREVYEVLRKHMLIGCKDLRQDGTGHGTDVVYVDVNRRLAELMLRQPMPDSWWKQADEDQRAVLVQLATKGMVTPHPRWQDAYGLVADQFIINRDHLSLEARWAHHIRRELRVHDWRDSPWARQEQTVRSRSWERWRYAFVTAIVALFATLGISEPELSTGGFFASVLFSAMALSIKIWPADDGRTGP